MWCINDKIRTEKTKRNEKKKKGKGKMKAKEEKYVYFFGAGKTEGNADMRELLGGKGANLAEMAGLGLPVPQGFTITTAACTRY